VFWTFDCEHNSYCRNSIIPATTKHSFDDFDNFTFVLSKHVTSWTVEEKQSTSYNHMNKQIYSNYRNTIYSRCIIKFSVGFQIRQRHLENTLIFRKYAKIPVYKYDSILHSWHWPSHLSDKHAATIQKQPITTIIKMQHILPSKKPAAVKNM